MIDASQRMLKVSSKETLGGISPPQKRHLELQIKTLQNAPRDAEKLQRLLKAKRRQKEEAMDMRLCRKKFASYLPIIQNTFYI
jgi:hypothetical protein